METEPVKSKWDVSPWWLFATVYLLPVFALLYGLSQPQGGGIGTGIVAGILLLGAIICSVIIALVIIISEHGKRPMSWLTLLIPAVVYFMFFMYPKLKVEHEVASMYKKYSACQPEVERIVLFRSVMCDSCDEIEHYLLGTEYRDKLLTVDTYDLQWAIEHSEPITDEFSKAYVADRQFINGSVTDPDGKVYPSIDPGPNVRIVFREASNNGGVCGPLHSRQRYEYAPEPTYLKTPPSFTGADVIKKIKAMLEMLTIKSPQS